MKKHSLLYLAALALPLSIVSCQQEAEVDNPSDNGRACKKVTVIAEAPEVDPETKTYWSWESDGIHFIWDSYDSIRLYDFDADGYYSPEVTDSDQLSSSTEDATFTANFYYSSSATNHKIVGVYPAYGSSQYEWLSAYGVYEYGITCSIPSTQYLYYGSSFDTQADLMISEPLEVTTIPSEFRLRFARVGTTLLLNLKGFPVTGYQGSLHGFFRTGNNYAPAANFYYLPSNGKLVPTELFHDLEFDVKYPYVGSDGSINVALRTLSGCIDDSFTIDLVLTTDSGEELQYVKSVDLASLGRSITLKEGGFTMVDVKMEPALVINAPAEEITLHEATLYSELNAEALAGGTLQSMFFYYSKTDYGNSVSSWKSNGTYVQAQAVKSGIYPCAQITRLEADTDYYFISGILFDDKEYYAPGSATFRTRREEVISDMVDLGLPSGTKWAKWDLGCIEEYSYEGGLYVFGETEPKTTFTWDNYRWGSNDMEYTKYSIHAGYGLNGLVDGKFYLDPEDDPATAQWGSEWRAATAEDFYELINNCTAVEDRKEMREGYNVWYIYGFRFTGPNGNSIWIPSTEVTYMPANLLSPGGYLECSNGCGYGQMGPWGYGSKPASFSISMVRDRATYPGHVRPVSADTRPTSSEFSAVTVQSSGSILKARFPGWDAFYDEYKNYETGLDVTARIFYSSDPYASLGGNFGSKSSDPHIDITLEELNGLHGGVIAKDCGLSGPVYYRAFLEAKSPVPGVPSNSYVWIDCYGFVRCTD